MPNTRKSGTDFHKIPSSTPRHRCQLAWMIYFVPKGTLGSQLQVVLTLRCRGIIDGIVQTT